MSLRKKVLGFILAVAMLVSVPAAAYADNANIGSGGCKAQVSNGDTQLHVKAQGSGC